MQQDLGMGKITSNSNANQIFIIVLNISAASLPPLTEPLTDSQHRFKETQRQFLLDKNPRHNK